MTFWGKMIYTTNTIESFNSALRKVTNRKAAFPSTVSVMKILYLRMMDISAKWVTTIPQMSEYIQCYGDLLSEK